MQQYLVREDGKWRVATGDSGTIKRFLANNPAFRAKFPIRQPRVFVKQGNKWVEFRQVRNELDLVASMTEAQRRRGAKRKES